MSEKTFKKFGFFTALSMVIGSVVGIGIFIKNESIFNATGGDGVMTLIAWLIGALTSLVTALSFAEIAKDNIDSNGGLTSYATKYVGKKFGWFIKITYPFLYFTILQLALGYFTYIFFALGLGTNPNPVGAAITILIAVPLSGIFIAKTPNVTKKIMGASVIIKFMPLLLGALAGVWFTRNGGGFSDPLPIQNPVKVSWINGLIVALPSVLFAFDAFLTAGSISKDVKNAERNIPLAVGLGMILVSLVYIGITASQIMQNSGTVEGAVASAFGTSALSKLISFIIVISAVGTFTSVSLAGSNTMQDTLDSGELQMFDKFSKKHGENAGATLFAYWSTIFAIFTMTISISVNTFANNGDLLDELSNMPTLFFFGIYAIVIAFYLKNTIKNVSGKRKVYLLTIGILSVISISTILSLQFYNLFEGIVKDGFAPDASTGVKNASLLLFPMLMFVLPFSIKIYQDKILNKK